MAEGGEGEDEIQFLRTVSLTAGLSLSLSASLPPPLSLTVCVCGGCREFTAFR